MVCIFTSIIGSNAATFDLANEGFIINTINTINQAQIYGRYFFNYFMILRGNDIDEFIVDKVQHKMETKIQNSLRESISGIAKNA